MKKIRKVGIAGLFLLAPLVTACGTSSETAPVVVETTETTIAQVFPSRIVSLSPTATEMLFAIGAGDQVIAVDNYSNFPAEAVLLEQLDSFEPNVEAIAALNPDLVIITYDPGNLVEQLDTLGIETFTASAVVNLDGVYEQIAQFGELTGQTDGAAELITQMRTDIEAILASVVVPEPPLTYYYELDPTYYSVTSNTFIGSVMGLFGLVNIADDVEAGNDYPQLSAEVIVEANPDVIMLADIKCCAQSASTVAQRDGWSDLNALAKGNVVELDDDIASRWGPRIVELVKVVAAAIASVLANT